MAKKAIGMPVADGLRAALKRKQMAQPSYSLRALARDLGVSPAFISKVMSGQKLPPKERLEKLSYVLELDVLEKEALVKAVMLDPFADKVIGRASGDKKKAAPQERLTSDASNKQVLANWANLAVLEGLTLPGNLSDTKALQKRLSVSAAEFKQALHTLGAAGLIEEVEGRWQKRDQHLYLSGGRSRAETRAFHEMMIKKAIEELKLKTSQEDYERRLINGFTFALNPRHMDRLKAKIINFLDELAQEASEGECADVYQCNLQLFPLTKATGTT